MNAHGDGQDSRLTDPRQYLGGSQHDMMRTAKARKEMDDRMEAGALSSTVGDSRVDALRDFDEAQSSSEEVVAARLDARAIGLRDPAEEDTTSYRKLRDQNVHGTNMAVPTKAFDKFRAHEDRQTALRVRFPMLPSVAKQRKLAQSIVQDETDEQRALKMRERLAKEFGVFNKERIDAFMLDDESVFPKWVRELAPSIKDRVMFGGLGITEEEEAQRERLMTLPREQREQEWRRLKAAKSAELGEERLLSPAEVRASRVAARKSQALVRKRRAREATLRQLQLREPERWKADPIGKVDFSARLATVARHVEAHVKTNGQWPLSDDHLAKAKRKQLMEQEKLSPLKRVSADFMTTMDRVSPAMREALLTVGRKERPIKRISRRFYAFRLQAIRDGNRDEHGRSFQEISRRSRRRYSDAMTHEEVEFARSGAKRREPNARGREAPFASSWPAKYDRAHRAFEVDPRGPQ